MSGPHIYLTDADRPMPTDEANTTRFVRVMPGGEMIDCSVRRGLTGYTATVRYPTGGDIIASVFDSQSHTAALQVAIYKAQDHLREKEDAMPDPDDMLRQAAHDVYKMTAALDRIEAARKRLGQEMRDASDAHDEARKRLVGATKPGERIVVPITGFDIDTPTALVIERRDGFAVTHSARLLDAIEIEPEDLPF